jgi:cysteine desulfuration protein SufE
MGKQKMSLIQQSPFGSEIQAQDVIETMSRFSAWEDRYRQVIQWGKQLPVLADEYKTELVKVAGCESEVWLVADQIDGIWHFAGDSDARIVKGLIAIVFAALNNKSAAEIAAFDIDNYFSQLGLLAHLSPSRGNGLKAIVEQIKGLVE